MDEKEALENARRILDDMANGIHPLTGEELPYDSFLNDVRISRALFFASGKLKAMIEKPARRSLSRKKFVFDPEKIDSVLIEDRKISLAAILRKVYAAYDFTCRIPQQKFCFFLYKKGIFLKNPTGVPRWIASPEAERYGIKTDSYNTPYGTRLTTLFDQRGQAYILQLLQEFDEE